MMPDALSDKNLEEWVKDKNTPEWMKILFKAVDSAKESRLLLNRIEADMDTAVEVLEAFFSPGDPEDYGEEEEEEQK